MTLLLGTWSDNCIAKGTNKSLHAIFSPSLVSSIFFLHDFLCHPSHTQKTMTIKGNVAAGRFTMFWTPSTHQRHK